MPNATNPHNLKILYIDLNSCFASVEQQCRPRLRDKPVAITNRLVPNSCIIAASYEAKNKGVKVGMRRREAELLCPGIIFAESEPSKYIYVHQKFKTIMSRYSADITMKSIDEGVINLTAAPLDIKQVNPIEIAKELKAAVKQEIGCYMRCNVGLSSNRFLAKLAAELHKPDGLDLITPENQRTIFKTLTLTDLPGINIRLERRLKACGINTPLDFLDAKEEVLTKMVFKSIDGHKWHQRLRGIEVDDRASNIKSVGRQYVLEPKLKRQSVYLCLAHLAEDVGYRLRKNHLYARGVYIWAVDNLGTRIHFHRLLSTPFDSDHDILTITSELYKNFPDNLRIIGITLYKLQDAPDPQLSFFATTDERRSKLSHTADTINHRFGARTIHTALTLKTSHIHTKVPFGSTRYLDHSIT